MLEIAAQRKAKLSKWSSEFPDPVADERSESEGSESDREEHTADRIAEKARPHSVSFGAGTRSAEAEGGTEGIPVRGSSQARQAVEVAVQAPEAQQDSLLVSSLCRWCHGAACPGPRALRFDASTPASSDSSASCC